MTLCTVQFGWMARRARVGISGWAITLPVLLVMPTVAQETVDFARDVQPILAANCYQCHGPDAEESGLRLDQRASAFGSSDSGATAIVPRDTARSEMVRRITTDDEFERMPPEGDPLTDQQVATLRRWIAAGADWQEHWAFRSRLVPPPPSVNDTDWVRNPIDNFVLHRLEENGLKPAPPADKETLLRRATYDLTGLPPTPEEVAAFLEDDGPEAFEKVVDRLLDSPRYGEHWARQWLDLVRFAETNSFERDSVKPHAWRYRDYVIRSFNQDKPYDQFVREQLAGDELQPVTADSIIATGYYRLGQWDDEPADRLLAQYDGLDDIVTVTGQVLLGLTVNCARCHDHKIDPITQRDYYSLLAFFRNITPMAKSGPNIERPIAVDSDPDAKALAVSESGAQPPATLVLQRGNPQSPGEQVEPGFPVILDTRRPEIPDASPDAVTSGRRSVLANWIASADNPMTAPVMVNRIWQHHFGRGIVRSPNNFGKNGIPPTHPELLDWLAARFVDAGWRLKTMHRLIMTSNTYRMSSRGNQRALQRDPANDLIWRFDIRRLKAEEIRDSIHAVNGRLNLKMYGPGIYPSISQEVLAGQSRPGSGWGTSPPEERSRRSIYIHVKRSLLTPLLEAFDLADPDSSCEARFVTTQPSQALAMLNGGFLNEQAVAFAERLRHEAGANPESQIRRALQLALCREPNETSVQRGLQLIASLKNDHDVDEQKALEYYCLVVFNLNEFIYLD